MLSEHGRGEPLSKCGVLYSSTSSLSSAATACSPPQSGAHHPPPAPPAGTAHYVHHGHAQHSQGRRSQKLRGATACVQQWHRLSVPVLAVALRYLAVPLTPHYFKRSPYLQANGWAGSRWMETLFVTLSTSLALPIGTSTLLSLSLLPIITCCGATHHSERRDNF